MVVIAVFRMTDDRSRWEQCEVQAMLAILTEMDIERQLDSRRIKKGPVFAEVARRLGEQGFNKT